MSAVQLGWSMVGAFFVGFLFGLWLINKVMDRWGKRKK